MPSLQQIESDLKLAMMEKNQTAMDVLRGLKTRLHNEKIAKGQELSEEDITGLLRSELKKRKEAAEAYSKGGRQELFEKESAEARLLQKYLPAQLSEADLGVMVEEAISSQGFIAKDFGKAMGMLKAKVGASADGSTLAKVLKEKLK